jgi:hypothetical protein
MSCGIYKLTSPSGKCYIGQSVNIEKRFTGYRILKCKSQPKIYNALKKYGANKFNYDIVETCNIKLMDEKEKYYIKLYDSIKNGYNCRSGGQTPPDKGMPYKGWQNIEFYIDGTLYKSIGEASKKLGIAHKTIHNRLNSINIKYSNYCYKEKKKNPKRRKRITNGIEFYIDGILYHSLKEAEVAIGVPTATIRNRLNSMTTNYANYLYKDESRNRCRHKTKCGSHNSKELKINDVVYSSISEAVRELKMPRCALKKMIKQQPEFLSQAKDYN